MKHFEIPTKFQSSIIQWVKLQQNQLDPTKKNFDPFVLPFKYIHFIFPRHFGFCYGVENAVEIAYKALIENQGKPIYLLNEIIHNPLVNKDLKDMGAKFIFNQMGEQIVPWQFVQQDDVVISPAFGTSLEIETILKQIGVENQHYDATCPFVEKVWNTAKKLSEKKFTIVVHGKAEHEETKATFSRTSKNAPSLIVRNIEEAKLIGNYILGVLTERDFMYYFEGKMGANFKPSVDLMRIGVVNQTTMLASETQAISEYLKGILLKKYGAHNLNEHFADTRDTLCYATNNNQKASIALLNSKADMVFVIGGKNSSNTTQLYKIFEGRFPSYFIENAADIVSNTELVHWNYKQKNKQKITYSLLQKKPLRIIISSGASCPEIVIDEVLERLLFLTGEDLGKWKLANT